MGESFVALIWLAVAAFIVFVWSRARGRGSRRRMGGVGSAAAAMVYDILNDDRKRAVDIIIEEKAAARDPEDKDGNLPDLEDPTSRSR